MGKIVLFAGWLSLLAGMSPAMAAGKPATDAKALRWVGCGISKKAYLTALAKAYEARTGVRIDVQGGGATRGIREVSANTADIGGSCRQRIFGTPEEKAAVMVPVAWDALAVIVHKDNPVDDISLEDLRRLYLGKIRNWRELGGPDRPVKLFIRKGKISGVGRTIRKLVFSNYDQDFAGDQVFDSSGPLEKAVVADPDAIAITGISSGRKRDVKILKLEGKSPTYENVKTGKYLLYRPLYLIYNPDSPHADKVKDFIKFADSDEGRKVIRNNNTVPYLEAMNLMRKRLNESRTAYKKKGLR